MDSWPQRPLGATGKPIPRHLAEVTVLCLKQASQHSLGSGVSVRPASAHSHEPTSSPQTFSCSHALQDTGGHWTVAIRDAGAAPLWVASGALPAFPPPSGQAWAPASVPPPSPGRGLSWLALLSLPSSRVPTPAPLHCGTLAGSPQHPPGAAGPCSACCASTPGLAHAVTSARGSVHLRLCSHEDSLCLELTCSWVGAGTRRRRPCHQGPPACC